MRAFFEQLFDYNFYANKRLIEACLTQQELPISIEKKFSHILNAHHIWNSRVLNDEVVFSVWQMHPKHTWSEVHYDVQRKTFDILKNTPDFQLRVDYESSEGSMYINAIDDILFHIINHSTHHRGQIMAELRGLDSIPPPLDYIFYKRK